MTTRDIMRLAGAYTAAAVLCTGLCAQVPWAWSPDDDPDRNPRTRSQWGAPSQWQGQAQSPLAPQSLRLPETQFYDPGQGFGGFEGFRSVFPQYPGFPTYPPGFGATPGLQGYIPSEREESPSLTLPPGLPLGSSSGWPSWIDPDLPPESLPPGAERGVIARTADRVWVLTPDEPAFTPLTFYSKFRMLESGSAIEVRNKGEFQVLFHDASYVRSRGPVRLGLPRLSEAVAEINLRSFRRLWVNATARPMVVRLPDGSTLELALSYMYLESKGGRAFVHNHGPETVQWKGRFGVVQIESGRRIDVLLDPPDNEFLSAGLELAGSLRAERSGRVMEVHGEGDGGVVTWSGARFRVRGGTVMRIDPLAGKTFPEERDD